VNDSFTQDSGNVKLTSRSSMIVWYLSLTYFKDFQEIERSSLSLRSSLRFWEWCQKFPKPLF